MSPLMQPAPVVVIGATGGVGGGITEALLEGGTPVLAVGRDGERLAALRQRVGAGPLLGLVPGSVADDAGGAELAGILRQLRRPIGGVVVSVRAPLQRGRLLDRPASFLDAALREDVLPHFVAARHLVPLLLQTGRRLPFLVIGGPGACNPWAGYGHLTVAAAALRMLVEVLRQELEGESVRVQQVAIGSPVRTARNTQCACPDWPSALDIGRRVCAVLADTQSTGAVIRLDPDPAWPGPTRRESAA